MLPCRDAAGHRADPRRNTLAHGKMDARCERAVGDLDQYRELPRKLQKFLAIHELVGESEHLVLEPVAPVAQSRFDVEQPRGSDAESALHPEVRKNGAKEKLVAK